VRITQQLLRSHRHFVASPPYRQSTPEGTNALNDPEHRDRADDIRRERCRPARSRGGQAGEQRAAAQHRGDKAQLTDLTAELNISRATGIVVCGKPTCSWMLSTVKERLESLTLIQNLPQLVSYS